MAKPSATDHTLLASFVLPVTQALRLRGIDALEVIEELGINATDVTDPDSRILVSDLLSLWKTAVEITDDEALGLYVAEQVQPQMLHGLGFAWLASDTIYDALKRTVRFSKFMATFADIELKEEGDYVHLYLSRTVELDQVVPAARDFVVAMLVRMCRLTLGQFISPVAVEMERKTPVNPDQWDYALSCRVAFDCETTRITWSLADISEPLDTRNPALAQVNDEQTESYLNSYLIQSASREVVQKIVEKLPDGPPNQQQIADAMHVSNRTLQRKLKDEGTSFKDLLQDTRLQLACRYLKNPSRSVLETAYLLGFSEPSTFSRAFKRWTGTAPAEYRQSLSA